MNILRIYHGNVPQIFQKHIFARWEKSVENNLRKMGLHI